MTETLPRDARIITAPDQHVFFGYYDVSPFSSDGKKLLSCHVAGRNQSPHSLHPVMGIAYYDLDENYKPMAFNKIAATKTWNWQQGCRLQWYAGQSNTVIYNTSHNNRYVASVQNISHTKPDQILPAPVYSVSPDGRYALTLDFNRLHLMRPGYGYNNHPNNTVFDGIARIDISNNRLDLITPMNDIMRHEPHASFSNCTHYINHLYYSQSGQKFMVMHLWGDQNKKRFSRILICDQDGKITACPNNYGHTSHYTWVDDDNILIFATEKNKRTGYYIYDLDTGTQTPVMENQLHEDGHPSMMRDDLMVTDTYPDRLRHQRLMIADIKKHTVKTLARIHTPPDYTGEMRCDLHPRLNADHSKICVDGVRNGMRCMMIFNLDQKAT